MQILESLRAWRREMVELTRDLISVATENPPGNHYSECLALLEARLCALKLDVRREGDCLLALLGSGKRTVYLHGHYDVVPRSVESQFHPEERGDNLFGRGSSDMKSGLAAMIYAVRAIQECGVPLDGRVCLVLVPDEETAGPRGSRALEAKDLLGRDGIAMITGEPTGGVVWNASRGAISLRVTVRGKPAHVGLQYLGVNAFDHMIDLARRVQRLKAEVETRRTNFRIEPDAARHSILMMGGECQCGSNFNTVPGVCSFTIDRRINPEEDLVKEKARLMELLKGHEVEILQEGRAGGSDAASPAGKALADSIRQVTGRSADFTLCPGLLETRFYASRGIPAFAYGPGLLTVSHGPNEFVPINNIVESAAVYALTASNLLKPI